MSESPPRGPPVAAPGGREMGDKWGILVMVGGERGLWGASSDHRVGEL